MLFFDRLSVDTASELVAEYSGTTKPIVFIDQFIDSREAYNVLALEKFILAVAETSIFFDAINVRKLAVPLTVISSSEVDQADLQKILNSLPVDIRRQDVPYDDLSSAVEYKGLFEGLVENVLEQNLRSRFRQRLKEFEKSDGEAFDVYLMACYMNMCRTLVSYDVMHLFIAPPNYAYVYAVVERIKSYVTIRDDIIDDHQDHFDIQSSSLTRITFKECSGTAFGRVFDRFHKMVSRKVIPDFPVFARYAYDNDFASKAYPNYRHGEAFMSVCF